MKNTIEKAYNAIEETINYLKIQEKLPSQEEIYNILCKEFDPKHIKDRLENVSKLIYDRIFDNKKTKL